MNLRPDSPDRSDLTESPSRSAGTTESTSAAESGPLGRSMSRRDFLGSAAAAASAFTIVPRSALGGPEHTAPSDRLTLAHIGCGTQSLSSMIPSLITRDDVQYTCVCDPNRESTDYVHWSETGLINSVRNLLDDDGWGADYDGIPGGREVAREVIEAYYAQREGTESYDGVTAYADFRELFAQETDVDAAVILTPDHAHATLSVAAMEAGAAALLHKPIANKLNEVRASVETARETEAGSHLFAWSDEEDYHRTEAWLDAGVIGPVREVHNWTQRPVWPQGWGELPTEDEQPEVPEGLDWSLWLGPEPDRAYHPLYTHCLYRGWLAFGAGCLGDMGNYSLFQPYRMLDLGPPLSVEARPNSISRLTPQNTCTTFTSEVAFPHASQIRFEHGPRGDRPPVEVHWYSGGMLPDKPEAMRRDGTEFEEEGMMFVGEDGIILCDFYGGSPRLVPERRMRTFDEEAVEPDRITTTTGHDEWTNALREGRNSRADFTNYRSLAEVTALAGVGMRFPARTLEWDSEEMLVTNVSEANEYVSRDYRSGWEL